jgi:hypothetical protein
MAGGLDGAQLTDGARNVVLVPDVRPDFARPVGDAEIDRLS